MSIKNCLEKFNVNIEPNERALAEYLKSKRSELSGRAKELGNNSLVFEGFDEIENFDFDGFEAESAAPQTPTTKKVKAKGFGNNVAEYNVEFGNDGSVSKIFSSKDGREISKFTETVGKDGKPKLQVNRAYRKIEAEALGEQTANQKKEARKQSLNDALQNYEDTTLYGKALEYFASGGTVNTDSASKETGFSKQEVKWAAKDSRIRKNADLQSLDAVAEALDAENSIEAKNALLEVMQNFSNREAIQDEVISRHEAKVQQNTQEELYNYLNSLSEQERAIFEANKAEEDYLNELTYDEKVQYFEQQFESGNPPRTFADATSETASVQKRPAEETGELKQAAKSTSPGGEKKKRAYLKRSLKEYANSETLTNAIKEAGTEFESARHSTLNPVADSVVDKAMNSSNPKEAINKLIDEIKSTTVQDYENNPSLASLQAIVAHKVLDRLRRDGDVDAFVDFNLRFATIGTSFGQFISAMQESSAPEAITNNAIMHIQAEKAEAIGNEQSNIEKIRKDVNELQKNEVEALLKSPEFKEFLEKLVSEEVGKQTKTSKPKKSISKEADRLASKIESLKVNHNDIQFSQVIPITPVMNAALQIVATSIRKGAAIAEAIEAGLKHIRKSKEYKSYQKHQQEKIEEHFTKIIKNTQKEYTSKDIENAIKNHYVKGNKGASLAKVLIDELGIETEVANEIQEKLVEDIEAKLESKLRQKFGLDKDGNPKNEKAITRKTEMDSMVEAIQFGALDSDSFQNHFADKFGFAKLTPDQLNKIDELIGKIFEYDGSEMSFRAKKELADFVAAMRPLDSQKFYDILYSATIRAALTGIKTIFTNIPVGSLMAYTWNIAPKYAMNAKAYRAARRAWKDAGLSGMGAQSFIDIYKSGFNILDLSGQKFDDKGIADGDVFDYLLNMKATDVMDKYKDNKIKGVAAYAGLQLFKLYKLSNYARAFDAVMNHKGSEMTQYINEYNQVAKDLKSKGLPKSSKDIAKIVEANLGYNKISDVKKKVAQEISQIKNNGDKVPFGYEKRRTKEILEESRDPDKVKSALDYVRFATLMNNPDGVLGYFYEKYTQASKIKPEKGGTIQGKGKYLTDGIKYLFNASFGLFMRIGITSSQAMLRNMPVIGLSSTLTGRLQKVNGKWQWKKLTPKQVRARLVEHAVSQAMLVGLFSSMFNYDDDNEEWSLDEDRVIDITGLGTGNFWENEQLMRTDSGGYDERKSLMIRAKINGDWVDVIPGRLIPHLLPTIAILGGIRDDATIVAKQKDDFGSYYGGKKLTKNSLGRVMKEGLADIITATTELSFASFPQAMSGLMFATMKSPEERPKAMIASVIKTTSRPVKTALQPNIIRDAYNEMISLGEGNKRTGSGITKSLVNNFYALEYFSWGENMVDRTDMFGYEIKHGSKFKEALNDIPFIEWHKKNDWRFNEPAWKVMQAHEGVVIPTHWPSGVSQEQKLKESRIWGEEMRLMVENEADYLISLPDDLFRERMMEHSKIAKKIARESRN